MGDLKRQIKKAKIHSRAIVIESFKTDGDNLIVEGRLDDFRAVAITTYSGRERDAGHVHGMVLRMLVGGMPAKILDAEAEMPETPMSECVDAQESVKKLIGLQVVYGFTKTVKEKIGGTNGCAHLTALAIAMGPAIIQAMAVHNGQRPPDPTARSLAIGYIKNTCLVWRENGQMYNKALEEIQNQLNEKEKEDIPI